MANGLSGRLYDADKRKQPSHVKRPHLCACGRTAYGNGGWSNYKKACPAAQVTRNAHEKE